MRNCIGMFHYIPGVSDVVLSDVSMEPVGEVEILVVHANDDVGHYAWHLRENPALNLISGIIF